MNTHCDLLIVGGSVIDGTGRGRERADVAISGERISAVGALSEVEANARIDARGRIVAPGFIDAHTHDDRALMVSPDMAAKVSQGVTTVVTGNCGVSLAPLSEQEPVPPMNLLGDAESFCFASVAQYVDTVEQAPPAVNLAMLVGHTTLRVGAMDDLTRAANEREREQMGERLEEALAAGCIGMSTGLAYPPAQAATTDEVVALAARLAPHGAIYTTHMRNERDKVVDSVKETLAIGEQASVPVVISHHKACGRANWGLTKETLALISEARGRQRVDLDVYPYTASSTVLLADWVPHAERVLVTWSEPHPQTAGRDLLDVQNEWGQSMEDTVARLSPAGAIYYQMDEADLRRVLCFTDAMIGSDGLPHDVFPHPRLWGTFPRVLGHYSRDVGLMPLEHAVRRMTSVPARVFGLAERGVVRAGAYADIVVFDPQNVIDTADFSTPTRAAKGIEHVIVNGTPVWQHGESVPARPGRVLRRVSAPS